VVYLMLHSPTIAIFLQPTAVSACPGRCTKIRPGGRYGRYCAGAARARGRRYMTKFFVSVSMS
jgi:hypothetical protein